MAKELRWGLLAAGNIARKFAQGVAKSRTGKVVAVASRSQEKADEVAREYGIPRAYNSYEALLADKDVQAVYISPPHHAHAEWAIAAALAGKHILCEKPLAMNHAQARAIFDAARENNVFCMEAFMYRCHPQTAKLVELLKARTIGEIRHIRATFSFASEFNLQSRIYNKALGGGGILDVGCYCVSAARMVAGIAVGKRFAEPIDLHGIAHIGPTGVDERATAILRFPGDIIAQLSCGVTLMMDNALQIFGTEGSILVPAPWIPNRSGGTTKIFVKRNKDESEQEIAIRTKEYLYGMEADAVAASLEQRQAPEMFWEDTLGNMAVLDRWRKSIGLEYDADKL